MGKPNPQNDIRKGQVYVHKQHGGQILIHGKKGPRWKVKVLTEKTGVYNGTHAILPFIIRQKYSLAA